MIDTLEASLWCFLTTENYSGAVLKAINLGGDTDTIAAITGSLAGAYYQEDFVLKNWFTKVVRKSEIIKLLTAFEKAIGDKT